MAKHPRWLGLAPLAVVVLAVALCGCPPEGAGNVRPAAGAGDGYLFCWWNLENFFDDKENAHEHGPDRQYDSWFAKNPDVLRQKLANLSRVLVRLNDGRGPDVLAVAEVESPRAAELLRDALNKRLAREELHYTHVLMEDVVGGRHISPAILTRLPVDGDRTHVLDKRRRILEGHVVVNDHELVVLASHWTSRVSSKIDEEDTGRDKYAQEIYGRFHAMYKKDPAVDLLVCGDFNDDPGDESVKEYLHATGDVRAVRASAEPLLLDLFAKKDPNEFGTLWHRGKWNIFDQVVVSPGMLDDRGWSCDPDSVRTVNDQTADRRGHPREFGDESDKVPLEARGYSDHFPVTVRLRVQGK